ncbi:MAG TPA: discoidin domain-containing protein, partial [Thermoanaerobaculia bacterium]|nr:discoidin domain-containing protein [Thermoanaerobaculia bacterium]
MLAPFLLAATLTLTIDKSHALARFDPSKSIGATIDVQEHGATEEVLTRHNVTAMLSAGFHPLSYRLATELGTEAWHWNPRGSWSDAIHHEGYWTSADNSPEPIETSYGYRLPRRGNTFDQSGNDGYSRIDDGDPSTFWKSNPYSTSPQWLFADLGATQSVDAMTISWSTPYAADYDIEFWTGDDAVNNPRGGTWKTLAAVRGANGGTVTTPFPSTSARYIRVLMTHSCCAATGDWRDRAGFAVDEIAIERGNVDLVRHGKSNKTQTVIWVSSNDPWHRASDIDLDMEQPGLDRVVASGLTRGLPMLTPVAVLYGTPDDAAAEIRFLGKRKYDVTQIEMGEEPDGQLCQPEIYAELYILFAGAIHKIDPKLQLGGPALQSTRDYTAFWPDARGRTSWMGRFLDALRTSNHLTDFAFFSFEWYPFDNVCGDVQQQLAETRDVLHGVLAQYRADGVPTSIPWLATEYGWSSYAAQAEVDLPGAIFNAEFVADFLAEGGAGAYFYGLEPDTIF